MNKKTMALAGAILIGGLLTFLHMLIKLMRVLQPANKNRLDLKILSKRKLAASEIALSLRN